MLAQFSPTAHGIHVDISFSKLSWRKNERSLNTTSSMFKYTPPHICVELIQVLPQISLSSLSVHPRLVFKLQLHHQLSLHVLGNPENRAACKGEPGQSARRSRRQRCGSCHGPVLPMAKLGLNLKGGIEVRFLNILVTWGRVVSWNSSEKLQ